MVRLIKAEFRKILTTNQWWILLLIAAVVAFAWAWSWTALAGHVVTEANRQVAAVGAELDLNDLSWSTLLLTRSINLATIFPMMFGGLALASELGRKTITTSFLTAPNRTTLLGAKAITYVIAGAVFGVAISVFATLGMLIGSPSGHMAGVGAILSIAAAGIVSCVLWTLLGVGVGAIIGSPVATVIVLLVYGLAVGPLTDISFAVFTGDPNVAGALPNGAGNGLTGATAAAVLSGEVQDLAGGVPVDQGVLSDFADTMRGLAGAYGSFGLWASGAILLAWAGALLGGGMARTKVRDIT
jgi:ABC-2 type transport system permease protein